LRVIFAALMFWLAAVPFAQARSLALIVGIDAYENLPSLAKALEDASGYTELFNDMGYEVTALTNPGSTTFRLELARFYDSIEEGDIVAFVYSGHGWSDGSQNFLVPADTPDALSAAEAAIFTLPLRNGQTGIMDEIAKRGASLSLAIIDACRDNPFAQAETRALGLVGGLAAIEPPAGAFIVYSAGANQTALDRLGEADNFEYSVFTRFFLPNLREFGDLRRAIVVTRSQVQEAASIINHNQRPAYYDELSGTACLIGDCDALLVTASAAPPAADLIAQQFAESEWGLIQNSDDVEMLGAYVERYRETVPEMAALALARLETLQPATVVADAPDLRVAETPPEVIPEVNTQITTSVDHLTVATAPEKPPLPGMTRTNAPAVRTAPPAAVPASATPNAVARNIVAECDAIAAMHGNPDNPPDVLGHLSLVNTAAEAAAICDVAARNHPNIPRMRFNLATALYDRGEPGDYERVHDLTWALVNEGYAPAGITLGNLYFLGDGVAEDFETASHFMEMAEAGGFVAASAILAYRDLIDDSRTMFRGQAFMTLTGLCQQGDVTAQYLLGAAQLFGEGVRQNVQSGLHWSELAGQAGHPYAYESIAEYYETKQGATAQDIAVALEYYDKAVAAGSATADYYVGIIYRDGIGVPASDELAFQHFQAASRLNHPGAYNNLAYMYEEGQFVDVDTAEAMALYEISMELGSETAPFNLAVAYLWGNGVPVNYAKSAALFILSLERGNDSFIEESDYDFPAEFANAFLQDMQGRGVYNGPINGWFSDQARNSMTVICDCSN